MIFPVVHLLVRCLLGCLMVVARRQVSKDAELFADSGLVESGCKAVIGQRLKLSGMRWTVTGAGAITTLRCQQASRPEDRIWQQRRYQTGTA